MYTVLAKHCKRGFRNLNHTGRSVGKLGRRKSTNLKRGNCSVLMRLIDGAMMSPVEECTDSQESMPGTLSSFTPSRRTEGSRPPRSFHGRLEIGRAQLPRPSKTAGAMAGSTEVRGRSYEVLLSTGNLHGDVLDGLARNPLDLGFGRETYAPPGA